MCFIDVLPANHLARFVVSTINQLDLHAIYAGYGKQGGAAYAPELLLGVLIYGYATGVFSSRKPCKILQLGNISLDGSKIHADASKSQAVSCKRRLELEARLRQEVDELFALAEQAEAVGGFLAFNFKRLHSISLSPTGCQRPRPLILNAAIV